MKAVTANRLDDGKVVYLSDEDRWTPHLCAAARFADDDADPVLGAARARASEIADAYLVEVDADGALTGRAVIRETIRSAGPTVRADLGLNAPAPSTEARAPDVSL